MRYSSAVPPEIAAIDPVIDREIAALAREAEAELIRFDTEHGDQMGAFAPILLRSEAAASSQIENLTASARQIFTAEVAKASRNAELVAANTRAMSAAIALADDISSSTVRDMHRILMDAQPKHTPGAWREEPVWIGTRAESPVGATFVAPAQHRVPRLMEDFAEFAQRHDIPALEHVAITHAQFETIHPFSDGNGRTGRAIAQAMLRHRGITRTVAVPVSAGLLADVHGYHAALTQYRDGEPAPIVEMFAAASLRAVPNARQLIADIESVSERWKDAVRTRQGSVKRKLLAYAARRPVFTAESVAVDLGVTLTNIYRDLHALRDAGVLQSKSEHRGPLVWRASEILAAIDAFAERAGRRSLI